MSSDKKIEILGANLDDIEFSLLNKEFQMGIFRAVANEEGLLMYVNKVLIEKLQYAIPSEFLYKKLIDLYYNPTDWLKHLESLKKEENCLFRNVPLKSATGKPINLDIYLTLMPPYVYGMVKDIKKSFEIQETKITSVLRTKTKDNEIIVIDLDRSQNPDLKITNEKEQEKSLENEIITDEEKEALLRIEDIALDNIEHSDEEAEEDKISDIKNSVFNDEAFYNAPFGVLIYKENTRDVFFNKKMKEIFEIKEKTIGYYGFLANYILPAIENCEKVTVDKDREDCLRYIINTLTSKDSFSVKVHLKNKQLYEYRIYPIIVNIDKQPTLYGKVLYLFEVTREEESIDHPKSLSFQDHLTGIDNRRSFDNILEKNLESAKRYKKPLSLIMFDIDNFKKINDTYGHSKGDEVLKEIALLVKANIRKSDIVARYGGEEFMILCPETKITQAFYLAEKIRSLIQNHKFSINKTITCSFGVEQYQEKQSINDFVAKVDRLLYKAKHDGRNRVEINTDSHLDKANEHLKEL